MKVNTNYLDCWVGEPQLLARLHYFGQPGGSPQDSVSAYVGFEGVSFLESNLSTMLSIPKHVTSGGPPSPTKGSSESSDGNTNRVWVRQAAIDAANAKQNPQRKPSWSAAGGANNSFRRSSNASVQNSFSSVCDSESITDNSSLPGRNQIWGWTPGTLVESSGGKVVIQLRDGYLLEEEKVVVTLPANALTAGDVLMSNDYPLNAETGLPLPPNDLITLTHLHEPAVVESMQHRYQQDLIYTNTGPVLIAVNPFQTIRGLYGETVQKKYWEKAEKNSQVDLPPHVYAIADASFRNMIRALEDRMNAAPETPNKSGNGQSLASAVSNQSILVSGESGAGKTVTAKFVMKYLAALSQRSVVLNKEDKRAYVKVMEQKKSKQSVPTSSPRSGSSRSYAQPSWSVASPRSKTPSQPSWAVPTEPSSTSSTPNTWGRKVRVGGSYSANSSLGSNNSIGNELSSTSLLSGGSSTIEAKVLQSNPILESFGNARTVRNDNSSRFGKFIEIQFTSTGKLVGAQIDTYLLEKVRLMTQSSGERNYHVFFELLSGAIDARQLRKYFLMPTATPQDFKMTASGTYDRRDGVGDQDTCKQLSMALKVMKFNTEEVHQIFAVTAAILHASNLDFVELPDDGSALDASNVHLQPFCLLLGVHPEDLSEALCSYTIKAGRETSVKRALDVAKAEKGLEALLKETYGALFTYLVERINDSIAFKDIPEAEENAGKSVARPAASIGVLDIFGFESFDTNSFEQLCINYCNETLQQQFNAFVLRNEQAEYEREGIEWSFIEFPENQDVLDLIEKRGTGLLSILDDQCRAPGSSDKAFALNVYKQCTGHKRFSASRKQTGGNQFSVEHYAGAVEYTAEGFVEKNRDELPRETSELLRNSENPFIRELAEIMENIHADPSDNASVGGATPGTNSKTNGGRATVGGQFRRQLKLLRTKVDMTSPHYIRCIKPNDMLIPDQFDNAVVAEQLRCGGILEAVRVARAGFTQHYPHAEFYRRYRALAWKELASKGTPARSAGYTPSPASWNSTKAASPFRGSFTTAPRSAAFSQSSKPAVDMKAECKNLIKILYRKLQLDKDQSTPDNDKSTTAAATSSSEPKETTLPVAKAKTYSYTPSAPAWSKPSGRASFTAPSAPSVPSPSKLPPAHGGKVRNNSWVPPPISIPRTKRDNASSSDYTKVGIQMGKRKVFLRHAAFEALERMRSREQTLAATKLNSIFRRYLARMAYIPYRDAFRSEMSHGRRFFDDFKETKEQEPSDLIPDTPTKMRAAFFMSASAGGDRNCLVDKWMESHIRDAIHNPVPRSEWGKVSSEKMGSFKWLLVEGVWKKNYAFQED